MGCEYSVCSFMSPVSWLAARASLHSRPCELWIVYTLTKTDACRDGDASIYIWLGMNATDTNACTTQRPGCISYSTHTLHRLNRYRMRAKREMPKLILFKRCTIRVCFCAIRAFIWMTHTARASRVLHIDMVFFILCWCVHRIYIHIP